MAGAEAILAAVERIHEAPLTSDGWARALPLIAAAVGSDGSFLLDQSGATGAAEVIASYEIAPQQLAGYAAAVSAGRPSWALALPAGFVTPSSAMVPDREFARSVFYNEVVRHEGRFYGLLVAPLRSRQRNVYLATGRKLGREDYNADDVAAMQALVPHLLTALRVSHRLAAAALCAEGACAALDRLEAGAILVDAASRVLFANRIAQAILSGNDGLGMDKEGLSAADPRATRALRQLIATCGHTVLGGDPPRNAIAVPRGNGRLPLQVLVAPFVAEAALAETSRLGIARPAAVLIVTDPEREHLQRHAQLRERFGLTPAEADFAHEIMKGDGRPAAASRLGISLATARTHLEHIFEKTGVHRQAELVRLLLEV